MKLWIRKLQNKKQRAQRAEAHCVLCFERKRRASLSLLLKEVLELAESDGTLANLVLDVNAKFIVCLVIALRDEDGVVEELRLA